MIEPQEGVIIAGQVPRVLTGRTSIYTTILSSRTVSSACLSCGSLIRQDAFMGLSTYFRPACQLI